MPAEGVDYELATPLYDAIEDVQRLKRAGHTIIIQTARGAGTGKDWRKVTERQLAKWGVPYDELHFAKPWADVYVDDRAVNAWTASMIFRLNDPVDE